MATRLCHRSLFSKPLTVRKCLSTPCGNAVRQPSLTVPLISFKKAPPPSSPKKAWLNAGKYRILSGKCPDHLRCSGKKGIRYFGGTNSPYIWFECPNGMDSWEFFDYLLNNAQVVGTPGAGFGKNGQNFFRLTSFGTHESTKEAMARFEKLF